MKKKPNSDIPEPRYIVDKTGKKVEVILDIKVYDQLKVPSTKNEDK